MGIISFHEGIRWKPLNITTLVLIALTLLLALFSPFAAAIVSFCLISLWSRVPCMMSDYAKDLEVIDFFTVLIVIEVGLLWGILFGLANMLFSRIFGPMEDPGYTLFDASLFIPCSIAAFLAYTFYTPSILVSLYIFTLVRYVIPFVLVIIIEPSYLPNLLMYYIIGLPIAYLGNTVLVLLFGNYTAHLLQNGISISWGLIVVFIIVLGLVGFCKFISKLPSPEQQSIHTKNSS